MKIEEALAVLRKEEKRKFSQSIDLVINLKGIDAKKDNISAIVSLPHKVKEKSVCAFLSKKSSIVNTVTNLDFPKYKDKKQLKNLVKKYDFFIAEAKLMPAVATTFGKVLGPTGKMPSPQLGVLMNDDENSINALVGRIQNSVKIRVKEPSVKISIGKESMSDKEILENAKAVYSALVNALPVKKDNIKNVLIKLTMSKPIKAEVV